MANHVSRVLERSVSWIFPERDVLVRTRSGVRHIHLTPIGQAGCAMMVGAGLVWAGIASHAALTHTAEIERIALDRAAVEKAWAARFERMSAEQTALEEQLEAALDGKQTASRSLGEAQGALVEAETSLKAADLERRALKRGIERLSAERERARERADRLEASLKETRLTMLREGTKRSIVAPTLQMPDATISEAMTAVVEERDRAVSEIAVLDAEIERMSAELDGWRDRQELVLAKLETAVRTSLEGLSGMLEHAGLDTEEIIAKTGGFNGSGGPFVPLTDAEASLMSEGDDDLRVAALMSDLERVNMMRVAVDRLPFGRPVMGMRKTSGFGKRRDPFRKRWSMHNGIDWAGPKGTLIKSTAEGVVTFAGRMRGYGRIVIIQHSFGYETRYAHLQSALVKPGDRVSRGDEIAKMGNTGRSSGTHLHYEVRIDGDPIDPKKFIEAARHVL